MKKMLRHLHKRSGFTLVECIIAIAVFGALTLIVFMILTNARAAAVTAMSAEEDLNSMVGNIIGDDGYKKFYEDSSDALVLVMEDGSTDYLSVSYNTVSGFKDYMLCTNAGCPKRTYDQYGNDIGGYCANRTSFMFEKLSVSDPATPVIDTNLFDPSLPTYKYICPECGKDLSGNLVFECDDCNAVGKIGGTEIGYDMITHSYYCQKCEGTSVYLHRMIGDTGMDSRLLKDVIEQSQSHKASAIADFSISGMYANAIRYGDVYTPVEVIKDDSVTPPKYIKQPISRPYFSRLFELKDDSGHSYAPGGQLQMYLTYTPNDSNSAPGEYDMFISNIKDPSGTQVDGAQLDILLPNFYDITDYAVYDGMSVMTNTNPLHINIVVENPSDESEYRKIHLSRISSAYSGGSGFHIKFRLRNFKSGYSFEYDYNQSGPYLEFIDAGGDGVDDDYDQGDTYQGLFAWYGQPISSIVRENNYPKGRNNPIKGQTWDYDNLGPLPEELD